MIINYIKIYINVSFNSHGTIYIRILVERLSKISFEKLIYKQNWFNTPIISWIILKILKDINDIINLWS